MTPGMQLFENDRIVASSPDAFVVVTNSQGDLTLSGMFSHSIEKPMVSEGATAEAQILAARQDNLTPESFDPNNMEPPAAGEIILEQEANELPRAPLIAELSELELALSTPNSREAAKTSIDVVEPPQNTDASGLTASPDHNPLLAFENSAQEDSSIEYQRINLTEDAMVIHSSQHFDASSAAQQIQTQYGLLSLNGKGDWQYQLNNSLDAIQELGAGDRLSEVIKFTTKENGAQLIEVTIHGNNDKALINGDRRAEITEDSANPSVTGKLNISDADFGEARFQSVQNLETTYGTVSIDGLGNWEYQLDTEASAVQSLRAGEQVFDTFSASSLDGNHDIVRISINGTNDAPLFTGSNQSTVYLGDSLDTSGRLLIHDADFGESAFIESEHLSGKYGSGGIDAQGHWHYQVDIGNDAIDAMNENSSLYDQLTVTTADGTTQQLVVIIQAGHAPGLASVTDSLSEDDLAMANTQSLSPELHSASELYIWKASDDNNGTDSISGFQAGRQGDTLIIDDLLLGQTSGLPDTQTLDAYLDFEILPEGTRLQISPEGENSVTTHQIVLEGFDASQLGSSNSEIIQSLMQTGNLEISGLA